jgi:FMN phosphatase YigB (HAD superfamily)
MRPIKYVFLDDGGVINDNSRRAPQWERLVGEFFVPRLGGTREQWAAANRKAIRPTIERFMARLDAWQEGTSRYADELRNYDLDWLQSMCEAANIQPPSSVDDQLALSREATDWIMPQVRADHPGATDAIVRLSGRYRLYMASGGASYELRMVLEPLGVIDRLTTLYGPDLVDFPKRFPRYYERIFHDAGLDPGECLVVDDTVEALSWAREVGTRTALISRDKNDSLADYRAGSLSELAEHLLQLYE